MKRITSIGEILFDVYPKFKKLGGAPFNFIYHIIKLTGDGHFISRIGKDENGKEILSFLNSRDISNKLIQIDEIHNTGEAIPTLNETKVPVWKIKKERAYDFIELTTDVEEVIKDKTDCLYFGTLAQREETSRKTIQSLFNNNIKFFCDLNIRQNFYNKETVENSLNVSNVLKLNEDELKLISNIFTDKKYDVRGSALEITNKYNIELLCVTLGENGSILFKEETQNHCDTSIKNEEIVDTVGAGDAFAAVLCLGYLLRWDISKINHISSEFASEIVKINGALPDDDLIYQKFRPYFNYE